MHLADEPDLAERFAVERAFAGGEGRTFVVRAQGPDGNGARAARLLLKVLPAGVRPHEASVLLSLRHASVPRLVEVGRTARGMAFVVREFVAGETLEQRAAAGRIEPGALVAIAVALLETLVYVHLRGVLHLDIKPANVVLPEDHSRPAMLVDFGLGRAATGERTTGGTWFFASPEQLVGARVDARSDLFGLGATLVAALAPHVSLSGFLRRFPREDFFAAAGLDPARLPAPFDAFLPRLLARDPGARFGDAQEALEALAGTGSGRPAASDLAIDPLAVFADHLRETPPLEAGIELLGASREDRRAVALWFVCRLDDVRRIEEAEDATTLRRAAADGARPWTLRLPPLEPPLLAPELTARLALDHEPALQAARAIVAAGGDTPARASAVLAALVRRGSIVPDGPRWSWPDAASGRLELPGDEPQATTPTELEHLAARGFVDAAIAAFERRVQGTGSAETTWRRALVEGLLLAGEPGRALPLAHGLPVLRARALVDLGEVRHAEAELRRAPESADARRVAAVIAAHTNDTAAIRAALDALAGDGEPDVRILRGNLLARLGDADAAHRELSRAREQCPLEERAFLRGAACTGLGELARAAGRFPEALALHGEALEAFRRAGNARHSASAASNLGVVAKDLGDFPAARDHLRRARALFTHVGDRAGTLLAEANLGIVQLESGAPRAALQRFLRVRPALVDLGVRHVEPLLAAFSARCRAALGDVPGALADAEIAERSPDPRVQRELDAARALLARAGEAPAEPAMNGPPLRQTAPEDAVPASVLRAFLAVNRRLASESDLESAMRHLLEVAETLTGARGGYLLVERDGTVRTEVRTGVSPISGRAFSRSLANKAIAEQRLLSAEDALADQGLMEMPSVRELAARSALCAPFRTAGGTAGAIYVEHPSRRDVFGPREIEYLETLADQAAIAVERMIREEQLAEQLAQSRKDLAVATRSLGRRRRSTMIGDSPPMQELRRQIEKLAATDLAVLVLGETGSGKELVAQAIHEASAQRNGPFVSENCSAIPADLMESELFGHVRGAFTGADQDKAGLFVLADGGSLFLDEVGDMPPPMQVKLLRALQERAVRPVGGVETIPVRIRLITATHRDLEAMVRDGAFREDLYYRIAAGILRVPPLRDRGHDVERLAEAFVERLAREHGRSLRLDDRARARLTAWHWPGNVRELEHVIARSFLLSDGDTLVVDGLERPRDPSGDAVGTGPAKWPVMSIEAAIERTVDAALEATHGDKSAAARLLGISRTALYDRLRRRRRT